MIEQPTTHPVPLSLLQSYKLKDLTWLWTVEFIDPSDCFIGRGKYTISFRAELRAEGWSNVVDKQSPWESIKMLQLA